MLRARFGGKWREGENDRWVGTHVCGLDKVSERTDEHERERMTKVAPRTWRSAGAVTTRTRLCGGVTEREDSTKHSEKGSTEHSETHQ